MPVAFRKGVNSCKLVCIDVATGSPKVSRIPIRTLLGYNYVVSGDWPSGKAEDSGSSIGGSNPSSPAMCPETLFFGSKDFIHLCYLFDIWGARND